MATVSFETTMSIDDEAQMKILLDALEEAEIRGPITNLIPEEVEARMAADLEHLKRLLDQ